MPTPIETFEAWFQQLTPEQKKQVFDYIHSQQGTAALKGMFVGPAPSGAAGACPNCGKPY
jgi:hypothetical protein